MINGKRPVHNARAAANEAQDDDVTCTRPIHLAASVGCAEVIDLLALAGADVNVSDRHGNTPVGTAAAKGYLDAVEVLLRHGAGGSDFTLLTESQKRGRKKGARPLSFLAAAGGNIKTMEVLLERAGGPEQAQALVNAVEPRTGKTALHFAAENGRELMVALLLKKGADKDVLCNSKQSALHLAVLSGCLTVVRILVEHGAKVLFSAAEAQTKKTPVSPLFLAATCQSKNMLSLFLEMGLDINTIDEKGCTPLHAALYAEHENLAFIEFFLEHGADAKAVDNLGRSVLHYALRR
ncbi:ankyrin repeat domain containing protein 44, putative [Acanthamoeba castellanii str. Neff]|uniref:Ankyrin repeat domain containing protein 44, putative n=1 Tax=Acanthamoeba castellanii (strain ATCC 30010 / Neff) TaxID=1257118 RepID=L8H837_ACACF|nr:ankyrin repeat domain containing protein 44, putative [Acanthamoeba castellanii str. Neff]ELR20903.1 ankyrin repeat domain containing protein 44, putative [Acanthamoeba castellanii str. Neff]